MEEVFQKNQQAHYIKNFNISFLISLFSTVYSTAIALKLNRDSEWIIFNCARVGYVFIAFIIGNRYRRLLQFPFLILEVLNTYAVMRFFGDHLSAERSFEIAIKKLILTFACLYPTYNWMPKVFTFLGTTIYINLSFHGVLVNWNDDMSWNVYLYVVCLGLYFYFDEKSKRILFRNYYNELNNLRLWKLISEKFLPTGC